MAKLLSLLLLMLISTSAGSASLKEVVSNPVMLYIETPQQIQHGWEARGNRSPTKGWATWSGTAPNIRDCEIHVPPLTRMTRRLWLHELAHCTLGRFH